MFYLRILLINHIGIIDSDQNFNEIVLTFTINIEMKKYSNIIFNKTVTVKACHCINRYHTLNSIFT